MNQTWILCAERLVEIAELLQERLGLAKIAVAIIAFGQHAKRLVITGIVGPECSGYCAGLSYMKEGGWIVEGSQGRAPSQITLPPARIVWVEVDFWKRFFHRL